MKLVASTLGNRVHHAAAGLAELGLEPCACNLEFLDNILAELEGDGAAPDRLGIKRVVVIASVYGVIVVVACEPVKTDVAEFAVGGGPGGQQNKIGEVTPVQW